MGLALVKSSCDKFCMKRVPGILNLTCLLLAGVSGPLVLRSFAEDAPAVSGDAASPSGGGDDFSSGEGEGERESEPKSKRSDRHSGADKETEGTRALNRFHTEPIKRSRYTLDGDPLEVDPD